MAENYKGIMEIFGNQLTYDEDGGIVPLYQANNGKIDMGFPEGPAGGRGDGAKETEKRKTDPESPQNILKKKTKEVKPNAPGGTGKESTADEEKDAKGMLQKLFERYDLVSLGADIASGKGLLEAVRDQEDTIKETAIAAEEKLYQRNREALSDALSISKAEVDKMYKQGLLSTDLIRDAEASADRQFPRGTAEHSRAFLDWMNTHADASVAKKMGLLTPQDITKESMMRLMQDNSNFADITQDLVNAQQGILLEDSNAGAKDIDATAGFKNN
tara:strand:+ start:18 stop:836 length:819 start_codon:yes stop_codon:yes gene_type:complete